MTQSMQSLPKNIQSNLYLYSLENPPHLQKTLGFYGVIDDNAWNRPATTSKKILQFYHKPNQSKEHLIASMKEKQIEQRKQQETSKKMWILNAKNEDRRRIETRALETNRLQFTSSQMLNIWDDEEEKVKRINVEDNEIKKMLAKKGVKIMNRDIQVNEWNDYTRIPKKTVEIIANDKIIKYDEDAVRFIGDKIRGEKDSEIIKRHLNLMKREKELSLLKQNHSKTYNLEQKIYGKLLPSPPNPDPEQAFPYKFYDKQSLLELYQKKIKKQEVFERLSVPKHKNIEAPEKNPLDYKEFRGLLIGDIDERTATQTDNELIKKLHKSQILQKNIEAMRNSRPQSTQSRRPMTAKSVFGMRYEVMPEQKLRELEILTKTFSDFNHEKLFEDKQMIEKQIDEFEAKLKRYKLVNPRVGYSQMKLKEHVELSTTEGYFKRKEEKIKGTENKFEVKLIQELCERNKGSDSCNNESSYKNN